MENNNESLANYAATYVMSVGAWNPSISSKEVKSATANHFSLSANQTTGGVYLYAKEYTDPLQVKVREIRRFFDKYTLKISSTEKVKDEETGRVVEQSVKANIIPSHNFWRVSEFTQKEIPEFDALKRAWIENLEDYTRLSIQKLGKLGEILDKKGMKAWNASKEEWAEKIYFDFGSFPMADPSSLGNLKGVTEDVRNAMIAETKEKYNLIEKAATKELNLRLAKVLDDFIKKMKSFKEGSRMHDSIIENISEMVRVLPDMVVNGDRSLVNLANEASLLTNWDVDILKENEHARTAAATTAADIRAKLVF